MQILTGIMLIYLASAIALGALIKFSLKYPAVRFIMLADFVIPMLALIALIQTLLSPKAIVEAEAANNRPNVKELERAEEKVEKKRQELFGHSSQLWVTKRFERRYNKYLERSVVKIFGSDSVVRSRT